MEVILSQDVPKLGKVGDVVKVKEGFARNLLLPNKLAYAATPSNLKKIENEKKKRLAIRQRNTARYQLPKDALIDYKNVTLLQKYLNDRGKIVPRRISGISAKEQRDLCSAIKQARYLGLLTSGSTRYR